MAEAVLRHAGSPVKWLKQRNLNKPTSHDSTTFLPSEEDGQSESHSLPDTRSNHELETDCLHWALGGLGSLAQEISCIPVSRDLAAGLSSIPFRGTRVDECTSNDSAILIVAIGEDATEAARVIQKLNVQTVPIIAVVIAAMGSSAAQDPEAALKFAKSLSSARRALLGAGANDVISLLPGECLQPHRVVDAIELFRHSSARVAEIVSAEVRLATENATRKASQDHCRIIKELLSVSESGLLEEWTTESGELTGVCDFTFQAELGKGAFGQVFRAAHPRFGVAAVKVVSKANIKNATRVADLDRELTIMRFLDTHPNVVTAHQVLHAKRNIHIVMDYAGELHLHGFTKAHLKQNGGDTLPVDVIDRFLKHEIAAIAHLHSKLVCHRDIKPSNWIVSDDGLHLRLADFGFAQKLVSERHQLTSCCGSLPFCAPEVFRLKQRKRHGGVELTCDALAADVWSLGVNFVELLRGPFGVEELLGWYPRHPKELDIILHGLEGLSSLWEGLSTYTLPIPAMHGVVSNMLSLDSMTRWTMREVAAFESDVVAEPSGTVSSPLTTTVSPSQPLKMKPKRQITTPSATPKFLRSPKKTEKYLGGLQQQEAGRRSGPTDFMHKSKSLNTAQAGEGADSWRQGWQADLTGNSRLSLTSPGPRHDNAPLSNWTRNVPILVAKPFLPGVEKK